mgnify:FL=1
MPKSTPQKLKYQKAYNAQPAQKKAGVERRRAERAAVRDGTSPIGDGKDIAHKVALDSGGKTVPGNLKLEVAKKNRDWRKGQRGYRVPKDS